MKFPEIVGGSAWAVAADLALIVAEPLGAPFSHVVMSEANHFIADVAMEVDAVASAFESLGIRHRQRLYG